MKKPRTNAEGMWDVRVTVRDLDVSFVGFERLQDRLLMLPDPVVCFAEVEMNAMSMLLKECYIELFNRVHLVIS